MNNVEEPVVINHKSKFQSEGGNDGIKVDNQ